MSTTRGDNPGHSHADTHYGTHRDKARTVQAADHSQGNHGTHVSGERDTEYHSPHRERHRRVLSQTHYVRPIEQVAEPAPRAVEEAAAVDSCAHNPDPRTRK